MKSQCWSAETLLRGVGIVAGQPQQRLSTSPMDPELLKEYQAGGNSLASKMMKPQNQIVWWFAFLTHFFGNSSFAVAET